MSQLSSYNVLYGSIFSLDLGFSSVYDFLGAVEKQFRSLPFASDPTAKAIEHCANAATERSEDSGLLAQERATALLIVEDLERIRNEVYTLDLGDVEASLQRDLVNYKRTLSELGVEIHELPSVFVVERFPYPMDKGDWAATTFFREDEKRYGMPRGVYFRANNIAPRSSNLILAHEIIHCLIDRDGKVLTRRLEEGICDLIGACYLSGLAMGFDLSRRILRNGLFSVPSNTMWWVYATNLCQAAQIYARFGLAGIIHILNEEQTHDCITGIESALLQGNLSALTLPKGIRRARLTQVLDKLTAFPTHFTLSPLAFFVAKHASEVTRIPLLAKCTPFSEREIQLAIDELASIPILLEKDGEVVSETAMSYIEAGVLRYQLPVASLAKILGLN